MRPSARLFLVVVAVAIAVVALVGASAGASSVSDKIAATNGRERQLQSGISSDNATIRGYAGKIGDLQERLGGLQSALDQENAELEALQSRLRAARGRLVRLRLQLVKDRAVLARQLVSEYETAPPDLVTVVMDAHGFSDLLERMDALRRVQRSNVQATTRVRDTRTAVATEATKLAGLEASKQRSTAAIAVQRDEVAQLKVALVDRQLAFVRARNTKSSELGTLRAKRAALEREQERAAATAAAAQRAAFAVPIGSDGGGGSYGFFQAPGTNYSVGNEPELAARLDRLGKALHLHLIGLSGYRTPDHSVEVGGFGNDPHTRGEASDTPGVEGVPESTLNQFGLTRPFGGAAEADHIQLA